jgi:ABC-2 type transport system permease protein
MTSSILGRSTGFTSGERSTVLQRAQRVWQYRRILRLLVGRDIKVRYANSALGYLWTVLDPLAMSLVYWYFFTEILDRKIGFPPYILFLVTGQLAWAWINGSINTCVGALRSESQFVRSSNVPRELWVLRVVLSKGTEYVFSLPVLVIFALAYQEAPTRYVILMPLAIVMTIGLCMGVGMILAPAAVLLRDLRSIVRITMRVLFFLSPILYSVHDINRRLHSAVAAHIVAWNPITGIMVLYRSTFFPQELNWSYVAHSALIIVVLFAIGVWSFTRLERPMLKEI